MKKVLSTLAVVAGVAVVGLLAGYWHFADMMPRRDGEGRALSTDARSIPGDLRPDAENRAEDEPSVEEGPTPPSADDEPDPASGTQEARAEEPVDVAVAAPETAAVAAQDDVAPSFGLLRVEPDGSAVIAGQAHPGSEVLLKSGDTVIARETTGSTGDFVMTPAQSLAVGDHTLRLETTDADGNTLPSEEVAVVSVPPAGREGELFVAVEAPNAPTRLLTVPTAATEMAASGPPTTTSPSTASMITPAIEAAPNADDGQELRGSLDVAASEAPSTPGDAMPPAALPGTAAGPGLAISAVEIEDDRIYVAGTAKPGTTIRLYLDDAFIAEADAEGGERFIAEALADVPVGSHVVRADGIGPDGAVIARVEVPFDRPHMGSMAALAPEVGDANATTTNAPAALSAPRAGAPDVGADVAARSGGDDGEASVASSAPPTDRTSQPTDAGSQRAEIAADATDVAERTTPPEQSRAEPDSEQALASASSQVDSAAAGARRQAALEPVDGRVIIRRGDTLWRISRNAYGLGSRYMVIYLANGDQIRDPDLIYPGQVFRMPGGRSAEGRSVPD